MCGDLISNKINDKAEWGLEADVDFNNNKIAVQQTISSVKINSRLHH